MSRFYSSLLAFDFYSLLVAHCTLLNSTATTRSPIAAVPISVAAASQDAQILRVPASAPSRFALTVADCSSNCIAHLTNDYRLEAKD